MHKEDEKMEILFSEIIQHEQIIEDCKKKYNTGDRFVYKGEVCKILELCKHFMVIEKRNGYKECVTYIDIYTGEHTKTAKAGRRANEPA
jgi:hypothetical protein